MATVDVGIYGNLLRAPKSVQEYQNEFDTAEANRTQNLLGRMKLDEAKRSLADEQAYRTAAMGFGKDTEANTAALLQAGLPSKALAYQKSVLDNNRAKSDIDKNAAQAGKYQSEAADAALKRYRGALDYIDTPEGAARWLQAQYQDPALAQQMQALGPIDQAVQRIPRDPAAFQQWRQQAAMGMEAFQKQQLEKQKAGQSAANDVMIPDGKGGFMVNEPLVGAKRSISKAGASNVNVKVDAKLGEGVAKEVGPIISDSYNKALSAQDQVNTADRLIAAVDAGGVMAGPGATFRLRAAQIGDMLGVTGKDTAEKIANTRAAIQAMAQSTLAARGAFKGQGAVTNDESKLAERAASGQIDDMTPAEIRQMAMTNKRIGGMVMNQHQNVVNKMRKYESLAPMSELFEIPAAGPGSSSPATPGLPSADAIAAELARRQRGGK